MKILGWMHRKLIQNSIDPMKNKSCFVSGAATGFSLQTDFMEPQSDTRFHNSSSLKFEESFEFLSIGTFGLELINDEPPTPTQITENDLDLISYELEKFLDAEETEFKNDTSERSSHASMITLSYKPIDGTDSEGHVQMTACPLQNYLLAGSVGVVEEREGRRERASLAELFRSSNVVEDDAVAAVKKCEGEDQKFGKGNVGHFLKKVVKKMHSTSNGHTGPSYPTKKKLSQTIVKMFSKKVYPEEMIEKQLMKLSKGRNKNISHDHKHEMENTKKKKTFQLSLASICKGASSMNAGHWIKTDSDYFVLEL